MSVQNTYLNPSDMSGTVTLSNNNLTASMPSGSIIRANYAHNKGKYYFEVKLDSGATTLQLGIATKSISIPSPSSVYVRCFNASNGNRYPENTSYGTGWVVGDVIGVALDLDTGKLEFYKNGVIMGVSHSDLNNLINQYGEIVPYFRNGSTTPVISVNFGKSTFKYVIPSGYNPYDYATSNKFLISSEDKFYSIATSDPDENVVPVMTSSSAPSGQATASNENNTSSNAAFNAFNRSSTTQWATKSGVLTGWKSYRFSLPKIISKYILSGSIAQGSMNTAPRKWTFEASNDGLNWIVLDRREGITGWILGEKKIFNLENNSYFNEYRLNIEENDGSPSYIMLSAFQMYENFSRACILKTIPTSEDFVSKGMDRDIQINLWRKIGNILYQSRDVSLLGSGKVFKQKIDRSKH